MPHDPDAEVLPNTRKDASDPLVQVHALTDDEYAAGHSKARNAWKPITLRVPFLLVVISITLGLVGVVQWLLTKSRDEKGILLASEVNDLPLAKSFLYLYLPTLCSVVYSLIWTWIDLDVQRLEPFLQLSGRGGAMAEDSVLLHYPFDFLAAVPCKAIRRRHWSVFASSMIMVLIFLGLTPTQSGLFAVRTVTITKQVAMQQANGHVPITQQGDATAVYAQSVFNIAWLNESVPPFMTKDFVLRAFSPEESDDLDATNATYTGETDMYSLDVDCEIPVFWNNSGTVIYNSTTGCSVYAPPYRVMKEYNTSKVYDSVYVGRYDGNGNADYYLYEDCPEDVTFWVRWSRSTPSAIASGLENSRILEGQANYTSLFCSVNYFQQRVNATISSPDHEVISTTPLEPKSPFPANIFNTSAFQYIMTTGQQNISARGEYPQTGWPNQMLQLQDLSLNLAYIPPMSQFAVAAYQKPMDDYLDREALRLSYQAANRLLFARRLVEVLDSKHFTKSAALGEQSYVTQAVIVVPGFAYAVQALLGLIACLGCWLTIHTYRRSNALWEDPANLLALMKLSQSSHELITAFSSLTQYSTVELEERLKGRRFGFSNDNGINLRPSSHLNHTDSAVDSPSSPSSNPEVTPKPAKVIKGVRPTELRSAVGLIFLAIQLAALATFTYLYHQAKTNNGLPLPSQSTLVRQIVQNYILIAVATAMEPFWLVLNRLICMLQPWEELRKGNARTSRSVNVNYSSLPPQFVIWRALKAKHVMLALICLMTILANGLAVALSGLLYEDTATMATPTSLAQRYSTQRKMLNGTGPPFSNPYPVNMQPAALNTVSDQFYLEMSNLTAGTPLLPWSDSLNAYLPVDLPAGNDSITFNISTQAIAADLDCQPLTHEGPVSYKITYGERLKGMNISVSVPDEHGSLRRCVGATDGEGSVASSIDILQGASAGPSALEFGAHLVSGTNDSTDLFCQQHIVAGWIRADLVDVTPSNDTESWRGPILDVTSAKETLLLCKSRIIRGPADVVASSDGRVQRLISSDLMETDDAADLVAQANLYLVDNGGTWHQDAYPSDFTNYLIGARNPNITFLDPSHPLPTFADAAPPFIALYRSLFATLVSTNHPLLFEPAAPNSTIRASVLAPETRIFVSFPAFVVSQTILALYVLVTIWLYLRRPWRILPRLPTSVATTVAYFAASHALREITERRDDRRCSREWRWGYGFFVGTDGKPHLGVEREPLLMAVGRQAEKGLPGGNFARPG